MLKWGKAASGYHATLNISNELQSWKAALLQVRIIWFTLIVMTYGTSKSLCYLGVAGDISSVKG